MKVYWSYGFGDLEFKSCFFFFFLVYYLYYKIAKAKYELLVQEPVLVLDEDKKLNTMSK